MYYRQAHVLDLYTWSLVYISRYLLKAFGRVLQCCNITSTSATTIASGIDVYGSANKGSTSTSMASCRRWSRAILDTCNTALP